MNWKATLKSSLYLEVGKSHQRSKHEPLATTIKKNEIIFIDFVNNIVYICERNTKA